MEVQSLLPCTVCTFQDRTVNKWSPVGNLAYLTVEMRAPQHIVFFNDVLKCRHLGPFALTSIKELCSVVGSASPEPAELVC
jgi:hypothetical protein